MRHDSKNAQRHIESLKFMSLDRTIGHPKTLLCLLENGQAAQCVTAQSKRHRRHSRAPSILASGMICCSNALAGKHYKPATSCQPPQATHNHKHGKSFHAEGARPYCHILHASHHCEIECFSTCHYTSRAIEQPRNGPKAPDATKQMP